MLLTECACTKVRRGARLLTKIYDEALAPYGLKVTQFSLLRTLDRLGETNISTVADATGLDRSTVGRNLRLMRTAGLVNLLGGNDLRTTIALISPKGLQAMKKALGEWERTQNRVKKGLGEATYKQVFEVIENVEALKL